MGKILVVNDVDFSSSAIEKVDFLLDKILSPYGCICLGSLNPSVSWGIRTSEQYKETTDSECRVALFDVTSVRGKQIEIYCTRHGLSDDDGYHRSWIFFSSDLGTLSIEEFKTLTYDSGGAVIDYPVTVVSLVDPSPVSVEVGAHTFTVTVPQTATFLIVRVASNSVADVPAEDVKVTIVPSNS